MDLKGSTLPFPMGLPLQNQEAGLGSQQVEFRADSGGTVPAERVSTPEPGDGGEQTGTGCCGARCWGSPCLGSLEVASLGVLKPESGRRASNILEDRLLQRGGWGRRNRRGQGGTVCSQKPASVRGAGGMKDGGGL